MLRYLISVLLTGIMFSCMEPLGGASGGEIIPVSDKGVFILNEGNFMYANASLSWYDPSRKEVWNEVFAETNLMKLGDVAQSMVIRGGLGYIVVNNSGVIFVIDIDTFELRGMITGFISPRYIHFLSDTKAYVTQLWDDRIFIVDPSTFQITGHIAFNAGPGGGSAEQMVQWERYLFVNCWSYDRRILVIDTETDTVVDEIETGWQPSSMVLDASGKIWVTTGGSDDGGESFYSLWRIDAETRMIEREFPFERGARPLDLALNGARDTLYFIDRGVWRMPIGSEELPSQPFIPSPDEGTLFYALGVEPRSSEIYVADAVDYVQQGVVYRYGPEGEPIDKFRTGIIPGAFCFK